MTTQKDSDVFKELGRTLKIFFGSWIFKDFVQNEPKKMYVLLSQTMVK